MFNTFNVLEPENESFVKCFKITYKGHKFFKLSNKQKNILVKLSTLFTNSLLRLTMSITIHGSCLNVTKLFDNQ